MMGNDLADPGGAGDVHRKRRILTRLAAESGVVFFELHIGLRVVAGPHPDALVDYLRFEAIQGAKPVSAGIVLILRRGPSGMRQGSERTRAVLIDFQRPASEASGKDFLTRPDVPRNRDEVI